MEDIIGYTAGILTIISFIPQVIKSWRTRKTGDLSIITFSLFMISALIWTIYGLLILSIPIIFTNLIVFALVMSILLVSMFPKL